ncbi:MAG: hypothetical protein ACKN9T_00420, partial [Candidatus Methylumidiphilus sp.]
MANHRPLLIFPAYTSAERKGRPMPIPKPHSPGRATQGEKLGPKFESLQKALETDRVAFQEDMQGLDPEFVLVIETRDRIEGFQIAAKNIGMDWLGEIDLEDLEPDEDFHELDKNTGQPSDNKLTGRLYLSMVNQQALHQLLSLWE